MLNAKLAPHRLVDDGMSACVCAAWVDYAAAMHLIINQPRLNLAAPTAGNCCPRNCRRQSLGWPLGMPPRKLVKPYCLKHDGALCSLRTLTAPYNLYAVRVRRAVVNTIFISRAKLFGSNTTATAHTSRTVSPDRVAN